MINGKTIPDTRANGFKTARPWIALLGIALCALTSAAWADLLEAEPDSRGLVLVDGMDRVKRHVILKNGQVNIRGWIDNQRLVADLPREAAEDPQLPGVKPGDVFVIDYTTGATEKLPWQDEGYTISHQPFCLTNGRIYFERWKKQDGGSRHETHWGEFGKPLEVYARTDFDPYNSRYFKSKGLMYDSRNCQVIPENRAPLKVLKPDYLKQGQQSFTNPLEPRHGWIVNVDPMVSWGQPTDLFLLKPDGTRVPIPTTLGERSFAISSYLPFADGYFIHPKMSFSDPHALKTPFFARLVHPDGRIERFPLPKAFADRMGVGRGERAIAYYTRRGPMWRFETPERDPDYQKLTGAYVERGKELVRVARYVMHLSPDGCKLVSFQRHRALTLALSDSEPVDYFVIDLCKD